MAFAISRSELLPFSRMIAAFGLSLRGIFAEAISPIADTFPLKCSGKIYSKSCLSKFSNRSFALSFFVCFWSSRKEVSNQFLLKVGISKVKESIINLLSFVTEPNLKN